MNQMNRRGLLRAAGGLGLGACAPHLLAQAPERLALSKVIIGLSPGGTTDAVARRMIEPMQGGFATTVLVENRTGAAGRIAIEAVKGAAPDGATMLLTPTSFLSQYPHIYRNLRYDPFTDFLPVSSVYKLEFVLAVGPAVPASVTNVREFVAWAKANPAAASHGVTATGSPPHMLAVQLAQLSGAPLIHAAYRGGAPAITDLVGGQIACVMADMGVAGPFVASGRARILASSGVKRGRSTPTVPTFAEQGFESLVADDVMGIYLPAGASPALVRRLSTDIQASVNRKEFRDALEGFGVEAVSSTPEELAQVLRSQYERWGAVVKAIGYKPE